jgi:hypothetical protein
MRRMYRCIVTFKQSATYNCSLVSLSVTLKKLIRSRRKIQVAKLTVREHVISIRRYPSSVRECRKQWILHGNRYNMSVESWKQFWNLCRSLLLRLWNCSAVLEIITCSRGRWGRYSSEMLLSVPSNYRAIYLLRKNTSRYVWRKIFVF